MLRSRLPSHQPDPLSILILLYSRAPTPSITISPVAPQMPDRGDRNAPQFVSNFTGTSLTSWSHFPRAGAPSRSYAEFKAAILNLYPGTNSNRKPSPSSLLRSLLVAIDSPSPSKPALYCFSGSRQAPPAINQPDVHPREILTRALNSPWPLLRMSSFRPLALILRSHLAFSQKPGIAAPLIR